MEFTREQMEKAKACKTLGEFKDLAKAEGLNLTDEEAKTYFNATRGGELTDDELNAVAGGSKWKPIWENHYNVNCPFCGTGIHIIVKKFEKPGQYKFNWTPTICSCGALIDYSDERFDLTFSKNGERRTVKL